MRNTFRSVREQFLSERYRDLIQGSLRLPCGVPFQVRRRGRAGEIRLDAVDENFQGHGVRILPAVVCQTADRLGRLEPPTPLFRPPLKNSAALVEIALANSRILVEAARFPDFPIACPIYKNQS